MQDLVASLVDDVGEYPLSIRATHKKDDVCVICITSSRAVIHDQLCITQTSCQVATFPVLYQPYPSCHGKHFSVMLLSTEEGILLYIAHMTNHGSDHCLIWAEAIRLLGSKYMKMCVRYYYCLASHISTFPEELICLGSSYQPEMDFKRSGTQTTNCDYY